MKSSRNFVIVEETSKELQSCWVYQIKSQPCKGLMASIVNWKKRSFEMLIKLTRVIKCFFQNVIIANVNTTNVTGANLIVNILLVIFIQIRIKNNPFLRCTFVAQLCIKYVPYTSFYGRILVENTCFFRIFPYFGI